MAPRRVCFERVARAINASYKTSVCLIIAEFEASQRLSLNSEQLYQLLRTARFHGCRKPTPRPYNALNAPSDAMSTGVAKSVKEPDLESHRTSTFATESLFATLVRGLASHDDGRGIQHLLESRSHGCAEAVHS